MRWALLTTLLAIGCGASSAVPAADPPKAEPKKDAAPAFDAKSGEKTLAWLAKEFEATTPPAGNLFAAKESLAKHKKALGKPAGEKVEWVVEAGKVLPDGRVGLGRFYVKADGGNRILFPTVAKSPNRNNKFDQGGRFFPAGKPDWLAKVKEGDKLILKGKLVHITPGWDESATDWPDKTNVEWWAGFEDFTLEPAP